MAHWASLIIFGPNCRCIQYLTVGPLYAQSKCTCIQIHQKIPIEQCKLKAHKTNFRNTYYCVFTGFCVGAPLSTVRQLYNKWSPVKSPLIQSCLSSDTEKKMDIIGTTWSGSDNTLSVKRALGLRHVFKKFLETTVLHKQWD